MAIGNINGDSLSDVVTVSAGKSIQAFVGNGTKITCPALNHFESNVPPSASKAFLGDFDRDGVSELLVWNKVGAGLDTVAILKPACP
jgi:hypothetical protein